MSFPRFQSTLARPVAVSGFGYWCGRDVRVEFRPAAADAGIRFVRDDLDRSAYVLALAKYRLDVSRRTNLHCRGIEFDMVEHILAALAGLRIDNCEVGVNGVEMPGCDGSAIAFVRALDSAGIVQQDSPAPRLNITEPVILSRGASRIEAHPDPEGRYSVEFHLDYPNDPAVGRQSASLEVNPESFRAEIAPCRTFVLQREADAIRRQGLGQRVTPRDLLVFDDVGPVDNVLRFENECARHKVLDVIGDMALTGCEIAGRIVAHRSGHQLNGALARELVARFATVAPLPATA
ncbi:MAG: UDP-3-O-acyl-N-acetylglucosamine deacetylase [Pirellulales bacterium]|nr:UDP-3-O-acyl-N-acetylglucosamine deacetylase [Pirellulales bacterium]